MRSSACEGDTVPMRVGSGSFLCVRCRHRGPRVRRRRHVAFGFAGARRGRSVREGDGSSSARMRCGTGRGGLRGFEGEGI